RPTRPYRFPQYPQRSLSRKEPGREPAHAPRSHPHDGQRTQVDPPARDRRRRPRRPRIRRKRHGPPLLAPKESDSPAIFSHRILTPHASAILLDPEYGLSAAKVRAKNAGLLLAYEKSGYDNTQPGRLPDLLDHYSVRRLVAAGADCIKILLYYTPFDPPAVNETKHAWVERIGAECLALDVPFFLEFVGYEENVDEKGIEFARKKPEIVSRSMEEFSKPQYGVDVLKVEVPVNMAFVKGARSCKGESVYSRDEAKEHFRRAA